MARPYYKEVKDGIFHVTSRGIARRTVFNDDRDCLNFLSELEDTLVRRRWRCLSYCLMVNHFHLLVQTPDANLADGMRDLKSGYATTYNARRGEDGSRFKAGYRPQLVQDNSYLMAAAVYVAQNPVRADLVKHPADWRWSSFSDTITGAKTFVDADPILNLFDSDPSVSRRQFSEMAHAVNGAPPFDPMLPIVGTAAFVKRHAPPERPGREVVKRAWEQARPTLDVLSESLDEIAFIRSARIEHRYTLRDIAEHLGYSERTIERRLRVSGAGTRRGLSGAGTRRLVAGGGGAGAEGGLEDAEGGLDGGDGLG